MVDFGIGIGSFMSGFAQGAQTGRALRKDQEDRDWRTEEHAHDRKTG